MDEEMMAQTQSVDPMAGAPAAQMASDDDGALNETIRKRLAAAKQSHQREIDKERQEKEMLKAKLQEMEGARQQPQEQMIPASAIPDIIQRVQESQSTTMAAQKLHEKVVMASEQDPELKELVQTGNKLDEKDIPFLSKFESIPNLTAVVKRLLKDRTDYQLFKMAGNDYERGKFIKELSDKLDGRNDERQKKYEPVEKLNGSAISGTNYQKYVDKYKGGR